MKIQGVRALTELIGKFGTKELSINSMRSVVRLNKNLQKIQEEHQELQQKLMEAYDIKANEEGRYDWSKHDKAVEITEKINDLFNQDFDQVTPVNFMPEEEFFGAGKSMNIQELTFLTDFIVEEEKAEGPKEKPKAKKLKKA